MGTNIKEKNRLKNFWKATFFGVMCIVVYIPFMIMQNLLSELEKANGFEALGFYLIGVLYLMQMVSSVLAVSIRAKIGLKATFFVGGINLIMVILCQMVPSKRALIDDLDQESWFIQFIMQRDVCITILVIGSALSGFGEGMIFVAMGEYVSLCATESTKGFYFGYWWALYMTSQIVGNFVGAKILEKTDGPLFFFILACIMLVGVSGFLFLRQPVDVEELNRKEATEAERASNRKDYGDDVFILDNLPSQDQDGPGQEPQIEEQPTSWQLIKSTLKYMKMKRMMFINPQLFWTGVSIAFWSGILTPIIVLQLADSGMSETQKQAQALMAMIWFGVGEVLGGVVEGVIIDRIGSKRTTWFNVLVCVSMTAATIWSLDRLSYDWVTKLMCFLWGFQDGALNIHCFQILGFQFVSQSEPFGVHNALNGLGVFLLEFVQQGLDLSSPSSLKAYTYAMGVLAILSVAVTFWFPYVTKEDLTLMTKYGDEHVGTLLSRKSKLNSSPSQSSEAFTAYLSDQN